MLKHPDDGWVCYQTIKGNCFDNNSRKNVWILWYVWKCQNKSAQFHSIYLSTDTDKHKQGDTHCMVGYRPDWGGDILFLIPCI